MITNEEILKLADWSVAREVQTKFGPRLLRKADPTPEFSAEWKARKPELKEAGASFSKNDRTGEWELAWWQKLDGAEQAKRAEAVQMSKASSAEIDLPHPPGLDYMPFQKAGIRYALDRQGVLFADEMGLGKTIEAIGVINADPAITSVLVICPKSLKLNWQRELERWLTRPLSIGVANGEWPTTEIVILNYEALGKHKAAISKREWGMCVVDEAHYIKNRKAQRSQFVKGYEPSKKEAAKGKEPIEPIRARRHLRLTGTPIVNRPAELQNIVDDLNPAFAGFGYLKRYCNATQDRFGWDFSGASNLDELQRRLRESIMVRRLKADVLTELPRKIRQVVELEPDSTAARKAVAAEGKYEEDSEERLSELRAAVELAKAESAESYEAAVARLRDAMQVDFTEMARLRHETALAKLPQVIQYMTEVLEDDEDKKIIVAAHHHDVIDGIVAAAAEAGWGPVVLTGRNTEAERLAAVDAFQGDPKVRVFVGGIQAAGVGITLTTSSHVIFAELDWVPGNMSQFEDRAHRIGQTETVLVQHLVLNGSLDARMAHMLVEKQRVIDSALDKDHPERVAPVYAPREQAATHEAKPNDLEKIGNALSEEQKTAILAGLKMLAGMDMDFARDENGVGFSKIDVRIGHSLAERRELTPKQAALGQKLVNKYRRQLPGELLAEAGVNAK